VHAGSAAEPRDVRAVVDDDQCTARAAKRDDRVGGLQELGAGQRLAAKLQKAYAGSDKRRRQVRGLPAVTGRNVDIDNRVESWKKQT